MDLHYLDELIVEDNPLLTDEFGELKYKVATYFSDGLKETILSGPTIHPVIKIYYLARIESLRAEAGLPALTDSETEGIIAQAVDLVIEHNMVYIRSSARSMDQAFRADAYLQSIGVPRSSVRFIDVYNDDVRDAIKRRGEIWRLQETPKSSEEIISFINSSRIQLGTKTVYYYSRTTGVKYLTCAEFMKIERLPEADIRACLEEIKDLSARRIEDGSPAVVFFKAQNFGNFNFKAFDFSATDSHMMNHFNLLKKNFVMSAEQYFREDNFNDPVWQAEMFRCLLGYSTDEDRRRRLEEDVVGLSDEFHSRVTWLPGCSITGGEQHFDTAFDSGEFERDDVIRRLLDRNVRGIIKNFINAVPGIEYINIARIESTLSKRTSRKIIMPGRRCVYIAVFRRTGDLEETVKVIRFQKRDVYYFLDNGLGLREAIAASESNRTFVNKRHEACVRLGLNLSSVEIRSINEFYDGANLKFRGQEITSCYYERNYEFGYATDKIPADWYHAGKNSTGFAKLLGCTAAAGFITGRLYDGEVIFDDGDEIVVVDAGGAPLDIVITEGTASFNDLDVPLSEFAVDYAQSVIKRSGLVPDFELFRDSFIEAFITRFVEIQNAFRNNRAEYESLFADDKPGDNFYEKWQLALRRLDDADAEELAALIIKECGR